MDSTAQLATTEEQAWDLACRHARDSLTSFLGASEADSQWLHACQLAGVSPDMPPTAESVSVIASTLRDLRGPASIVGHSLAIRVRSYQLLSSAKRLETYLDGESK